MEINMNIELLNEIKKDNYYEYLKENNLEVEFKKLHFFENFHPFF